jgi:hypothetical protein
LLLLFLAPVACCLRDSIAVAVAVGRTATVTTAAGVAAEPGPSSQQHDHRNRLKTVVASNNIPELFPNFQNLEMQNKILNLAVVMSLFFATRKLLFLKNARRPR